MKLTKIVETYLMVGVWRRRKGTAAAAAGGAEMSFAKTRLFERIKQNLFILFYFLAHGLGWQQWHQQIFESLKVRRWRPRDGTAKPCLRHKLFRVPRPDNISHFCKFLCFFSSRLPFFDVGKFMYIKKCPKVMSFSAVKNR